MVAGAWGNFGVSSLSTRKGMLCRANLICAAAVFAARMPRVGEKQYDAKVPPRSESNFRRLMAPRGESRRLARSSTELASFDHHGCGANPIIIFSELGNGVLWACAALPCNPVGFIRCMVTPDLR